MPCRAWIIQSFKVSVNVWVYKGFFRGSLLFRFEGQCFSLSQGNAYTFKYQKADREGNQRRRSIHLRLSEEAIFLLPFQGRDPSLPTEAACPLTLLLLRHLPLLRDEQRILIVAMAIENLMGWSISMRNTEPVLTPRTSMTGVPVPSPLHPLLPLHWLGSVSEWALLIRMSGVHCPLLQVTWRGIEALSEEPPLRLLLQLVMVTPTSVLDCLRCQGRQCTQFPVPGKPTRRECRRRRHHRRRLAMQAIKTPRV